MPKYRVTYSQYKVKVIRASSLKIAEERAKKAETGRCMQTAESQEHN